MGYALGMVFWIWWCFYWGGSGGWKSRIEKLEAQIKKLEKKND